MPGDKYTAVWVSHSSISDFLRCPRAYYLNNVYRNQKSGHKITLMAPVLALGQAVHVVLESIAIQKLEDRLKFPLMDRYENSWKKFSGKYGGFKSRDEEAVYKNRGANMIRRVKNNPGPILRKAIKIKEELPHYWLSEKENIILCGKIDWLEYLPEDDSVHIIDFKTGKHDEKDDSLQLPIYRLLVENCQRRKATKASFWYLDRSDAPTEVQLPTTAEAFKSVINIARKIKAARESKEFKCSRNGCYACEPLEAVVNGYGEFIGVDDYKRDIYILK